MEACPMDPHLAYKMEKIAVLKKRSAEETKPIRAIYDEKASAVPSTSDYFRFLNGLLGQTKTWGTNGTFKVLPQWYQQLFTIHAFVAGKLVPAVYWQEWITDERLPLWNVHNLLIAMGTLIQQVLSKNATVGDLRRVNKVYAEKQQRVAQYTGEYTSGSCTLEQYLEALMYITTELI
ncbi:hypothetical protein T12_6157 [Trichinella patagoniensis]|uniref:Uncharacterized protein n=1 Tax=Trichinella patagoniensis TaxID=990121 RepID=A0A0V1ACV1_9BILA|nr:hypothetical protein T12_6157 [Trichinella patagoniensis]